MKILAGSTNTPLALSIAEKLGEKLSPLEIFIFPDGEKRVRIEDQIAGEDVVIIQPTSSPADNSYMELFFITDAAKRSGAKTITAVIPYLGYQRQDHVFRSGEAVSLEVIAGVLKMVGVNYLITFDLHSIKIPEVFQIPVFHLSALSLFADELKKKGWDKEDCVLVSPDMGGIRRIKLFSEMLNNMPFAVINKNRNLSSGEVEAVGIEGEVAKRAVIVDDMISSGNTIIKAAQLLYSKGASEIIVFATHAVLSIDAPQNLQNSQVSEIYVSDTVFIPENKYFQKMKVLSIADITARTIKENILHQA